MFLILTNIYKTTIIAKQRFNDRRHPSTYCIPGYKKLKQLKISVNTRIINLKTKKIE
jgi:hypothetical protein